MRAREGPAKNLLIGRRETPSKTQRHYGPLLVFIPISKSVLKNLAGFHVLFAEITKCKELGAGSHTWKSVPICNISPTPAKIKSSNKESLVFLVIRSKSHELYITADDFTRL